MSPPLWFLNLGAYSLQIALLAIAGTLLPVACRLRAPRVLLAYWQGLVVACLLLPALQPWRPALPKSPPPASLGTVRIESSVAASPKQSGPFPIYRALALVLAGGIGFRLAWLGLGLRRLGRYRGAARLLDPLPAGVEEIRSRLGVAAGVLLSREIDSPVTFGSRNPVILFPARFAQMEPGCQRAIACHELLHVRRNDWTYHLLEEFIRALFWFHPGTAWLIGRIRLCREQVVDQEVLRLIEARKPYLDALLEIASVRLQPVPAPLFLAERQFAERVAAMLKEVPMSKRRLVASLTIVVACLAVSGGLAVWSFPLKAPAQDSTKGVSQDKPQGGTKQSDSTVAPEEAAGIIGGVPGGVVGGVLGAVVGSVTVGPKGGVVQGVPGGQVGGVTGGVIGGPGKQSTGGPVGSTKAVEDSSGLKLIQRVEPEYPPLAKMARIEGDVSLEVHVNEKGNVFDIKVLSGHPLLVKAAVEAVTQWRYAPPANAPATTTVTLKFRLGPNESAELSDVARIQQLEAQLKALPESDQALATGQSQQQEAQILKQLETTQKQVEAAQRDLAGEQYNQALRAQVEALKRQQRDQEMLLARLKLLQAQARRGLPEAGSGESALKPVHTVNPVYPEEARKLRVEGNVVLDATVNEKGDVVDLRVIDGPKLLVKAAIDAVKVWRYSPPAHAPAHTTVTINFTLAEPSSSDKKSGIYKYKGTFYSYGAKRNAVSEKDSGMKGVYSVGENVIAPTPISQPMPAYSKEARAAKLQGSAVLSLVVNSDGTVSDVQVEKPLGKGLDESAVETVKTWKFKPGERNGVPVPVRLSVEVMFRLM